VVYCGVDDIFRPLPPARVDEFRRQRALPEHFILFLGTIEPRKNVQTLIRAYARWRQAETSLPKLIVAGGKGWYYDRIFAAVESLGLTGDIIFPGYVEQEELPLWYNAADLFVYPSRFEGFGLPVLEAMACGVPVVTTNASSLPEVAGDAALLVAPDDEGQLVEAMRCGLSDQTLRQEIRAKGLAQAARFSWEYTARRTLNSYHLAMEQKQ
jgi:glycosyltransferase involved in cell wall biosynthesis